ncbi:MAG: serine/threonine protein kinase [Candidatus Dadabacteria bacterium]|nr:MAG: serine/threonine protein kinase [Candidatus Dadabacteria bacterium]
MNDSPEPLDADTPDDAWGEATTRLFYDLTPDTILDAVEQTGLRCTGRCLALNSLENRVFEIEIEPDAPVASVSDRFVVAKFYRPGRWSRTQILDEHAFLAEAAAADLPVVAPLDLGGDTLGETDEGILFTLFPRRAGRTIDEVTPALAERLGALVARLHAVGRQGEAPHRLHLTPETYGLHALDDLLERRAIPPHLENELIDLVEGICETSAPWFDDAPVQRLHGDMHLGNLLLHPDEGLRVVDFDDMVNGPPVQDLWLLAADPDAHDVRDALLRGYRTFGTFDMAQWRLVEPLRALRYIHFAAWIARRWTDPAFPDAFPNFGTDRYWDELLADLREQWRRINALR